MATSTAHTTAATSLPTRRVRAGAIVLLAGIASFGLGQVVHGPEVSATRDLEEFVAAMSSSRLAAAHLLLATAAALLVVGTAAVYGRFAASRSERTALAAFLFTTAGAAIVILGLGAAALAYPHVAAAYAEAPDVLAPLLEDTVLVLAVISFGAALLVIGGILVAAAVWRSDELPRWRAIPYALALPAILATEYSPGWTKAVVALGVTAAAAWLAAALWRAPVPLPAPPAPGQA